MNVEGGRVRGVQLGDEALEADRVVVAAGSWTTLIPGLPFESETIYPVRGQMIATHTRPPIFRRVVFGAGGYVVTRPDGRVLCGSTMERVGFARGITFGGMADVIGKATRIAPALAASCDRRALVELSPGTPDGLPLVGETRIEGLFVASGHYRNGILLAPLTAELIADAMAGNSVQAGARRFRPHRFEEPAVTAVSERKLTANGLAHHVIRWGDRPVDVVLCHGFLDIGWSFDAVARDLVAAGHGVASFDWRGHGQTEWIGRGGYYHFPDYVLDLDELLPQLSDQPVHLVGHSMGGSACVMYAAARPETLRSLTLIEGLGPPEMEPRDPATRLRAWLDGVARVRSKTPKPMDGRTDV